MPDIDESIAEEFPEAQGNLAWRRWMRGAGVVLGGFAFLYVGVTFWAGRSIWGGAAAGTLLNLRELPLVIGLVATGVVLRAIRFYYYGRRLGWTVPPWPSFVVLVASFALTATPGKTGELLKSALLRARYGTPVAESAGVLIVERLGDLLALLLLASSGLLLFSGLQFYFFLSVAIVAMICVAPRAIFYPILQWSARYARFGDVAERLTRILHTTEALLKPEPLLTGLGLAVVAWGCEALAFHVLTSRLPAAIPLLSSFSIFGLASVAGALSMLPGGLGGVEAVMVLLLAQLGADVPSATVTVIVFRLCTLYLMTVVGLGFLGWWKIMTPAAKPPRRSVEA